MGENSKRGRYIHVAWCCWFGGWCHCCFSIKHVHYCMKRIKHQFIHKSYILWHPRHHFVVLPPPPVSKNPKSKYGLPHSLRRGLSLRGRGGASGWMGGRELEPKQQIYKWMHVSLSLSVSLYLSFSIYIYIHIMLLLLWLRPQVHIQIHRQFRLANPRRAERGQQRPHNSACWQVGRMADEEA